MRWFFALIFLFALGSGANVAEAAKSKKRAEAKKYFKKAETRYRLGQFEDALELYSKAYERLPEPAFLFNIGQCHRNLGNYERAIYFFRGFLKKAKEGAMTKEVNALIAALEKKIEGQKEEEARRLAEEREREREREEAAARALELAAPVVRTTTTVVYVPAPAPPAAEAEETATWPFILAGVAVAVAGGVAIAFAVSGDGGLPGDADPALAIDLRDR